jgi:hypothetical protein
MRLGRPKVALILTDDERMRLDSLAHRSRTTPHVARRARIILACADGHDNTVVAKRLRSRRRPCGSGAVAFFGIGIRMALGAPRANIARRVVGEIVLLVAAGAIAGALASFGLTRYVSSLIFGLTPNDPLTFVAAAIVLLAVGLLAGYLPARRAARIDPLIALRYE